MRLVNKWLVVLLLAILLVGCVNTVIPPNVHSSGASFDNGERNGGFLGWTTNSSVCYGMISTNAYLRYNALIEKYGKKFVPPLIINMGITPTGTNYLISLDALSNFGTMNRWRKSNIAP